MTIVSELFDHRDTTRPRVGRDDFGRTLRSVAQALVADQCLKVEESKLVYSRPLVPDDFEVPARLTGEGYILRMLSIDDVEKDFDAVVESSTRLLGLFGPSNPWPTGVTHREDLVDLGWHEREFTLRRSFAYTVMSMDESRCLGCCYIFPSQAEGFDAVVFYWVRAGHDADARDAELGARLRIWLASSWPFKAVAYPGRDIPWTAWRGLQSRGSAGID